MKAPTKPVGGIANRVSPSFQYLILTIRTSHVLCRITSYNVCYTKLLRISRAVVRDLYETTEAARMLSLLMLVMGAAPILAPLAGGQFLLFTGWRGIFAFLGVFGLLSIWGTVAWLPESLPAERRIPVITSYSIHYTKLYERSRPRPNWFWRTVALMTSRGR